VIPLEADLTVLLLACPEQDLAEARAAMAEEHAKPKGSMLLQERMSSSEPEAICQGILRHFNERVIHAQAGGAVVAYPSKGVRIADARARVWRSRLCGTVRSGLCRTAPRRSPTVRTHGHAPRMKQPRHVLVFWMNDRRRVEMRFRDERKEVGVLPCGQQLVDLVAAPEAEMLAAGQEL